MSDHSRTKRPASRRAAPIWALALGGAALALPGAARAAPGDCAGLQAALASATVQISVAAPFAGGLYTAPDGSQYPAMPAFCRVAGTLHPTAQSNIGFEVWLPEQGWNARFQGVGNGGLAGAIVYNALAMAVQQGYAAASTDDGHQGASPLWMGNAEQMVDFGTRAVHETATIGQQATTLYYGDHPRASYFVGCSEGGREALMEAQRFPTDYDGIVAGDPFSDASRTVTGQLYLASVLFATPQSALPLPALQTLNAAVLNACDGLDGVVDGVLTDPRRCHYNPAKLLCQPGATTGCLTPGQVDSALKFYTGARNPRTGAQIFPGQVRGSEDIGGDLGWYIYQLGVTLNAFSLQILPYAVFDDPTWNYKTFNYDTDTAKVDAVLGPVWNATDPDLSAFKQHGGKLILYHGFADWLITPYVSLDYFQQVRQRTPESDSFFRMFMAPGVGHCTNGPGPNAFGTPGQPPVPDDAEHSVIAALDRWVTTGHPPRRIIATKYVNDTPAQGIQTTRPLCPFPQRAIYKGHGSTDDAANFVCASAAWGHEHGE